MNWNVKLANRTSKEMKKIPKKDAERLLFILEEISENPYRGDIEKIKGEENTWRRRIGSYRIIYEIFTTQKLIWVFSIKRRTTDTY